MSDKVKFGLPHLLKCYGTDAEQFLEEYSLDDLVPCVCVFCGYTTELEPDQNRGWCIECNKNSMISGLFLMGAI